jgi:hypothetical protein
MLGTPVKIVNTTVLLYLYSIGHETLSISQREGHRLRILDSEVLRIILGTNTGGYGSRFDNRNTGVSTFVRVAFI